MTTHLQPGQHPDADQLNAFAEHALPLHEQQATLAHLATCADCRAIVYLAQPLAFEPSIHPHPATPRHTGFSRWMLAFPAAAALACLIVLTIHIHNLATEKNQVTAVNTAHDQAPPLPSAAPPPEPAAPPTFAPESVHKPSAKSAPAARTPGAAPETGSAPAADATRAHAAPPHVSFGLAASPNRERASTPDAPKERKFTMGGMSGASYASATPPPAATSTAGPTDSPQAARTADAEARRELRSAAAQYDMGRAQAQQAPTPAPPSSPNNGIYAGTGQTNLNQNYIAAAALADAAVQSASSAALDTVTVDSLSVDTTAAAPLHAEILPTLPSKLPALSITLFARRQLAIDTAGTLFRSEDAGVTWQPVPAQWTGRAVKVARIPSPNAHSLAKSSGSFTAPPIAAKPAAAPPAAFELTTDAGDLWISADGQTWKRQ